MTTSTLTRPAAATYRPRATATIPARPDRARTRARQVTPGRAATVAARPGRPTACSNVVNRSVYLRRRATVAAVIVGLALAALVMAMNLLGSAAEAAVTPPQAGVEVVHVKSGESMTELAQRVAPQIPADLVIRKIGELNALNGVGLRAGQPLLTPVYAPR